MKASEFIRELVEELVDRATDFGYNPSEENEIALAVVSELLYNALKLND